MLYKDLSIKQRDYKRVEEDDNKVIVFIAKNILTMSNVIKTAEAVAVENGKIIAIGSLNQVKKMLEAKGCKYELNDKFKENVILPGFIEAHMHCQYAGVNYNHVYVGYFDCHSPNGEVIKGCKTIDEIIDRLKKVYEEGKDNYDDEHWLNAYGIDPLVLGDAEINSKILDTISSEIPICINHMSGHLMSINSRAIELSKINEVEDEQIGRYEDGTCNGNVAEIPNMQYVLKAGGMKIHGDLEEIAYRATIDAGKVAKVNGCTTITDKAFGFQMVPKPIEGYKKALNEKSVPCRLVVEPYMDVVDSTFNGFDGLENLRNEMETDMFMFGNMKVLTDGSIQGYTAHLLNDKYFDGMSNSKMIITKEELKNKLKLAEEHGYAISMHTNGNGATETVIEAIEELHSDEPNTLFRHSLEHNQLVTENQLARMKKQNIVCNFFINHIYYWGDVHAKYTVGPNDIKRMNPLRSAKYHDVRFSVHSDFPVTEVNPLFSAWVACNRKSVGGNIYGEDQCLTVDEALHAVTIDAAWLLGQEDNIGSIEVGKWADFVVLDDEPTEDKKETLKDINIITTILGGKVME